MEELVRILLRVTNLSLGTRKLTLMIAKEEEEEEMRRRMIPLREDDIRRDGVHVQGTHPADPVSHAPTTVATNNLSVPPPSTHLPPNDGSIPPPRPTTTIYLQSSTNTFDTIPTPSPHYNQNSPRSGRFQRQDRAIIL